ncbi:MAG: hypothetical protein RIE06_18405 [Roseibium album]|uniref:hypothetical protein n=1 Tax=Roseibium album TaxID=311410 RepID=UPI0032EDDA8E
MLKKLRSYVNLFQSLDKLSRAADFRKERKFSEMFSALDSISCEALDVDIMLMRAAALIELGEKKKATLLLAKSNERIRSSTVKKDVKTYLELYSVLLIYKAADEDYSTNNLLKSWDSIDLSNVPGRTKRLFPIEVYNKG